MSKAQVARALWGASLLALTFGADTAWAQASSQTGPTGIRDNDIIVTARRKDERLQDVPSVVNAVTAETIGKLNLRDFKDVQYVVPGLQLTTSTNGFSTGATVRGIKFDAEAGGTNPSVEFYLNDAPIASNVLFSALYDVGQFELLRGPQGTLRGRAAPSGSITVTTRKPSLSEYGGYVTTTANDIGGLNANGAVNLPLIKDLLGVRIAGYTDRGELNRVTSVNSTLHPSFHTNSYRISARLEPSDYLAVNVSYMNTVRKQRSFDQVQSLGLLDSGFPLTAPVITPSDRLGISDGYRSSYQRFDQFNWSADLRFGGQKLSYVGSHSIQDIRASTPYDNANRFTAVTTSRSFSDPAGAEPVCATNGALFGYSPNRGDWYQCTHTHSAQDSHELRLASEERLLGMFSYVVGGFINHYSTPTSLTQETAVTLPSSLGGGLASFAATPIVRTGSSTEHSAFGNLTAYLGSRTEVAAGVRYIDFRYADGLIVGGAPKPSNQDSYKHTIFDISAKHNFSDAVMAYAHVGSSWRPGVRAVGNFSANQSALERSFLNLAPETSTSYEAGIKTSFLNGRAAFNIAYFHQDFKNYAFRAPSSVYYINYVDATTTQVSSFSFVGAVPVKVDGLEAEASMAVTRHWNINANFSYANGRISNARIPCNDLNGDGIPDAKVGIVQVSQLPAGDHLSACNYTGPANIAPKWTATFQSEYNQPLTNNVDGYLRGLLNVYPGYIADPYNLYDDVRAYSLFNLYLGIRSTKGQWDLSVFGKNLFNTTRALTVGNAQQNTPVQQLVSVTGRTTNGVSLGSNYVGISTTPPREFGLNFRFAFGSR